MLNSFGPIVEQSQTSPAQDMSLPVPLDAEWLKQVSGGVDDGPHDNW